MDDDLYLIQLEPTIARAFKQQQHAPVWIQRASLPYLCTLRPGFGEHVLSLQFGLGVLQFGTSVECIIACTHLKLTRISRESTCASSWIKCMVEITREKVKNEFEKRMCKRVFRMKWFVWRKYSDLRVWPTLCLDTPCIGLHTLQEPLSGND